MQELIDEFNTLLTEKGESKLQTFLEKNTEFIPREFVQNHGIHFSLVLKKLKIAEDYITDFFYLSKSSDTWHCVLIEIEKPTSKFFTEGKNEIHSDFRKGLDQINKWRAWFSDNDKLNHFVNNTIGIIRTPLERNKCYIKYVLVTGRRSEYEANPIRKNLIISHERDDFQILTFDSLKEGIYDKNKLYLGSRKNEHIEILSSEYLTNDSVFKYLKPEQLRLTQKLKSKLLENSTYSNKPLLNMQLEYNAQYFEKIESIETI